MCPLVPFETNLSTIASGLAGITVFPASANEASASLKSVHGLTLQSYLANNDGRMGIFGFEGVFENGDAVVKVTVVEKDGAVRVMGFYLKGTRVREGVSKLQT